MKRNSLLCLILLFSTVTFSQISSFPYNEGFENAFVTGTTIDFIPNWNGNEVQTSSRIFRDGTNMRTGTGSLAVIPISTFNGTIIVNLSFSSLTNVVANFWARSAQNSTGSKPAIVKFSVSIDGGITYSSPTQIGVDTTFANSNTAYANYSYNFPASSYAQSSAKLKIAVSPGTTGSGTTARFVMDDFSITGDPFTDVTAPTIFSLNALTADSLDVKFSEVVEQSSAETLANYVVNNGIGSPSSAVRDAINFSLVHLSFATTFGNNVLNTIVINNVKDFSANSIQPNSSSTFTYYVPENPQPQDIVINEVLFNARTGGDEFVEIYNRSQKVIDLKNMRITREDLTTHTIDPFVTITNSTHLMLPGDYLVLSDDFNKVKNEYIILNPNAYLNMNLPDLLTDEDILILQDSAGNTLDKLHYYSSWHFPLLNDVDGVSLERLNLTRLTQDQTNWHSAAESAGFATPGYKNSEHDDSKGNGNEISVDPEIFSPDNDGHNDVVNVHYHFDNPGNVANVIVYDSRGRLIRNLVNNELIGNDGSFAWDGITNQNDKARIGMYIFYIEVYDLKGNTKNYKKTCVLASKL